MPPKIDWENDPECIEMMKFLIERTKDVESPMSINGLAKEFKEKSGCSQEFRCLISRIRKLSEKVAELDTIDKKTKVKMIFALSISINEVYLDELQKDADVEIDGNNRITKYRAKDGSVELTGDHSRFTKLKETLKQKKSGSQEDSGDGSQDSTPKTPGSVKRSAVDVPNSSKRTNVKSEDSAPDDSARIPSRGPPNAETQLLRQPKLEGDPGAEEAPISRSGSAPRASGAPEPARVHIPLGAPVRPNSEPNHAPGAPIHSKSEATDVYTPQIKFLESIQFLILNLDTPSLSPLQAKIDEKLRESSPNEKIANDEMIMAIETLVTKIVNRSVLNLAENVESISLKEFLCYLKAAILHSKLKGLEDSMDKIKERIKEPASKDKEIPIEKVISVLQHTLDGI
ncbi:unnamed protein product [Caenorhabditis brenneri]